MHVFNANCSIIDNLKAKAQLSNLQMEWRSTTTKKVIFALLSLNFPLIFLLKLFSSDYV